MHPGPQSHIVGVCVAADCRQVKIGARARHVGVRPWRDVLFGLVIPRRGRRFGRSDGVRGKAFAGAEVDIPFGHLEGKRGQAGLSVVHVPVPPVEGDLARFDP